MSAAAGTATLESYPAPARAALIALVCGLAAFMEVLDTSIANVSLGNIAGSLSASREEATWVLTSYLVANAIILPMTGWLSDTLGRSRYYLGSMFVFTLTSMLCGLSLSLPMLIVCRVLQGLAGAALQPISQAILVDSVPPEKRGSALSVYGMSVLIAPAVGPVLGGWLTAQYSWHWIFLINVPVGAALMVVASRLLKDSPEQRAVQAERRRQNLSVDYLGFALIALGMGTLQLMLDKGQQEDWFDSRFIQGCALVAATSLGVMIWRELRHEHPIVNLRLLGSANFAIANLMMAGTGVVLMGTTLLLPQLMQELMNYTSASAGVVMSPAALLTIMVYPLSGVLMKRFDSRLICSAGLLWTAGAMLLLSRIDLGMSEPQLMVLRVIQLMGIPFMFMPVSAMAYVGIPRSDIGSATAIMNLTRNLGGGIGISLVTSHLIRTGQQHQAELGEHLNVFSPAYQAMMHTLKPVLGEHGSQALMASELARQATHLAFIDDFHMLALFAVALVPFVWLTRRPEPASGIADVAH